MARFPGFLAVVLVGYVAAAALAAQAAQSPTGAPIPPPAGAPRPGTAGPVRDRAAAVAPATGTAILRGRVLNVDGSPLRRAQISAFANEGPAAARRVATTDGEGRWELTDLPGGRYSITASKAGFVTLQYGQRRPFEQGTPVVLADAQTIEKLDLALPRGSVITGRITDEFGEPIGLATVSAMRYQFTADGSRRLSTTNAATTDDRGEFRIYGLMPGEYVIQSVMRPVLFGGGGPVGGAPPPETFAPSYYPGTPNVAEAQTVSLNLAQETTVQMQLVPARATRLTGVVVNSSGQPVVGASLSMVTPLGDNGWSSSPAGTTGADGTFTIVNVSSGEHSLTVAPARNIEGAESASVAFTAGNADLNLRIRTSPGTMITGRVIWDGSTTRPASQTPIRVLFQQAVTGGMPLLRSTPSTADGSIAEDGTFRFAGAWGKGFIRVVGIPNGWILKSVTVDGEDITDVPTDIDGRGGIDDARIVLSDKQTELSGQVTDTRGTTLKDYVVVLLPSGLREAVSPARFVRLVRPDQTGRFSTKGLPAGRYTATALEWIETGRQFAPEFQQELRKAGREVTLRDGETSTLDLRITAGL